MSDVTRCDGCRADLPGKPWKLFVDYERPSWEALSKVVDGRPPFLIYDFCGAACLGLWVALYEIERTT